MGLHLSARLGSILLLVLALAACGSATPTGAPPPSSPNDSARPRASVAPSPSAALTHVAVPAACRTANDTPTATNQGQLSLTDISVIPRGAYYAESTAIVSPRCLIELTWTRGRKRFDPDYLEAVPVDGDKPVRLVASHWPSEKGGIDGPVVVGHWVVYSDSATVGRVGHQEVTSVAYALDLATGTVRALPHTRVHGVYTSVLPTADDDHVIVQITNSASHANPSRAWLWSPGRGMRRLADLPGNATPASFSGGVGTYEALPPPGSANGASGRDCWSLVLPSASSAAPPPSSGTVAATSLTPDGHVAGCAHTDGWLVWGEATSRGQIEENENNDEGYEASDRVLARPLAGGPTRTLYTGQSLAGFSTGDGWVAWTLGDYSTLVLADPSTGRTIQRSTGRDEGEGIVLTAKGDLLAYSGADGDLHVARVTRG